MSDHQLPDDPRSPDPTSPEAHTPSDAAQHLIRDESINPDDPYEGAVPPGYDWPTHGGYLGCLFGVIASCLIGGFVGSTLFPALAHYNLVPGWVAGVLTLVVFVLLVAGIGRLGYALGRRFLREYPQPTGKTWGEDDDFEHTLDTTPAPDAEPSEPSEPSDASAETGAEEPAALPPHNGIATSASEHP